MGKNRYRKVPSSRPVCYSILNSLGQRVHKVFYGNYKVIVPKPDVGHLASVSSFLSSYKMRVKCSFSIEKATWHTHKHYGTAEFHISSKSLCVAEL